MQNQRPAGGVEIIVSSATIKKEDPLTEKITRIVLDEMSVLDLNAGIAYGAVGSCIVKGIKKGAADPLAYALQKINEEKDIEKRDEYLLAFEFLEPMIRDCLEEEKQMYH